MKIGFIGIGVMGTGIINNLRKNNYDVTVYNRTKAHAQKVLDNGAKWADNPTELTKKVDILFTMVGFPKDVEDIYFGQDGILIVAKAGQYVVDMTTSKPSLAQKIDQIGEEKGLHILDALVSDGDIGAKNGTLTAMIGGHKEDLNHLHDLFITFARKLNYFGSYGSGQHAKMANQIMIAGEP